MNIDLFFKLPPESPKTDNPEPRRSRVAGSGIAEIGIASKLVAKPVFAFQEPTTFVNARLVKIPVLSERKKLPVSVTAPVIIISRRDNNIK